MRIPPDPPPLPEGLDDDTAHPVPRLRSDADVTAPVTHWWSGVQPHVLLQSRTQVVVLQGSVGDGMGLAVGAVGDVVGTAVG
jgi:hypothetical protein